MNSKLLYLSIDVLCILFPLVFSFHGKSNFYKKWKSIIPSILLPAIPFLIWDAWFTKMGVWGFNPFYITGVHIYNLPIEEVLFFISVPYACLFTYNSVNQITNREMVDPGAAGVLSDALTIGLVLVGIYFHDRWYTSVTFISTGLFVGYLNRISKVSYIGRFYFSFMFILIPFFIVNGVLTGTGLSSPVVWYKNLETIRIRIGTIPFEDIFYGMLLLMMNVALFEYFQKKAPLRSA